MANYIRENWSSDLDFGTGEWTCSAWLTVPATGYLDNYPLVGSELIPQPLDFTAAGWNPTAAVSARTANSFTTTAGGGLTRSVPAGKAYSIRIAGETSVSFLVRNGSDVNGAVTIPGGVFDVEVRSPRITEVHASLYIGLNSAGTVSFTTFSVKEIGTAIAADRSAATGPGVKLALDAFGKLVATAFDGTTTRTVTTTQTYNTGTWLKARANYRAGRLSISVNGIEVASANGAPLATLNNSNAVLTIGNSFALDAPFPGSIALVKFSAGVPTAEQSLFMYEQEKQMFRAGAQVCLPDAGSLVDLTYDDATDKWIAISATNESEFSGLVRTSVTPAPAGSYIKATATSGVQLLARSTTTPGVDLTMPAYGLRSELVKRAESAAKMKQDTLVFDFDTIGFTAAMTTGSNQITASSITGTPFVGMVVTGTGVPANTTIAGINGTTYTLSANCTATGSNAVGQAGFDLPTGYTARVVYSAGQQRREGSTRDYTRLFDGFREQIRFAVTPGASTWVQIHAVKEIA